MMQRSQSYRALNLTAFIPRLWVTLLALAIPFLLICANYCEAVERTGMLGGILPGMLLSAIISGYLALIIVLKVRRI